MNELDATLDSMGPEELRALEAEIDKKASDTTAAYYLGLGAKAAREQYAEFQKTGKLSPALFLVKSASGKIQKDAEFSAALDKCSAEELAEIEAELDGHLLSKISEEIAASYFEQGKKLARTIHASMAKEAARGIPKVPGFLGALEMGMKGLKGPKAVSGSMGHRVGTFMREKPLASAGIAMGAGVVGSKLLDR
jgi:hypothetical protein